MLSVISPVVESDIETSLCPLCGSSNMSIIHIFDPFKVVLCRECSLIYLNPRLKESVMGEMYQEDTYFFHGENTGYSDYKSQEKSLRITFRRFLNELKKRNMTWGRLLDVGCGYGFFLDEAKSFSSYIAGTELSTNAGDHAKRLTGAEIFTGDINLLPQNFNNFDIIFLINVIEHVYTPVEFLMSLKQRLVKGGKIIIATPDIGSFWYKLMKKNWPSFKIPEHVVFYTEKTLFTLLNKVGLCKIERIPFLHAFPLSLIISKLGIRLQGKAFHKNIWLPKTMVALSAREI